jgi:cupin fold WbuC family metalloprotein
MHKIFSKIKPDVLLHCVRKMADVVNQESFREDLIPEYNFIQCSSLKLPLEKTFKPHKHIEKQRTFHRHIAQESWIVVRGKVKCIFYDLDDTIVEEVILYPGDASFTLKGGHNYVSLEEGTIVYEYKTGPYEGQAMDKTFIE